MNDLPVTPGPGARPRSVGFPPIAGPDARVLVLGSLPGRRSLEAGEYYAHPRNAFWRIMGRLFDAGLELPYAARTARLTGQGIAVWDVLRASYRPGSLDAGIDLSSAECNDFAAFLAGQPRLRMIAFNGRKAAEMFRQLVVPMLSATPPDQQLLPSTSPAHAAMAFDEKLRRWSVIRQS